MYRDVSMFDQYDWDLVKQNPEPMVKMLKHFFTLMDKLIPIIALADAYSDGNDGPEFKQLVTLMRSQLDDIYGWDPEFQRIVEDFMQDSIDLTSTKSKKTKKSKKPSPKE
jgi:hypothetical protein